MALNFPDSPSLNEIYTDLASGFSYQWDGTAWQSYTPTSVKNILIIDDVSGSFNGSTDTFALVSNGVAIVPANAQQLRVTLGGIVQKPTIDYTVASSNITFTTPPTGGLSCSIVSLGPAVPVNTIADGSITPAKLSTGGPSWNSGGDVVITGTGSTALLVNGNARVTGILTVGTSSLTLNGNTNQINGITISSGVVTATSFYGDGSNLTNAGSTLGAASGVQRIVVTSETSGTMTSVGTDADLSWDSTTNTLSATNVSIAGTLTYEDVTNVDSIGIVTARAGIVLGPTANTIQLGTGTTISSPASDTFTILTGGSERVRVSSAGSFGLGTNDPHSLFSLTNPATSTQLTITTVAGANDIIKFDTYNGSSVKGIYSWFQQGSESARITPNSGFSVGTTADPGAGAIYATGDITAFYSSDIRLKKDIEPITEPIKKLMEISGVTYKWNEEYLKDKDVDGYFVKETEVGVIAQDVEKVLPEVVATRENGYKAVRYEKLVALLIEAVKDQQHQIDELKARLEEK